jgi:glycine cleavage system H protein
MSDIPAELRYSQDHLWVGPGNGTSLHRIGLTDYAQNSLGDVLAVTLPAVGDSVTTGEAFGDIESIKSLSDMIAPVSGTVGSRNDDLTGSPELVNTDPYGNGWVFEVQVDPANADQQLAGLMDAEAYGRLVGE